MFSKISKSSQKIATVANSKLFFSAQPQTVIFNWGAGTTGQLGHAKFELKTGVLGNTYEQEEPRKLVKSKRFKSIAIGEEASLGITYEGQLFGWGHGVVNFSGSGDEIKEPVPLITDKKIVFANIGSKHAAIIDSDGKVYTWGNGGDWFRGGGQLAHGGRGSESKPKLVQFLVDYGAKIKQVACGSQNTFFLTDDGEVLSCGIGEYGRLGTGATSDATEPAPLETLDGEDIIQISAGFDHTLALSHKGDIYTWGRNHFGQLGHADSFIDIYSMEDYPRKIDPESFFDGENDDTAETVKMRKYQQMIFKQIAAGNGRSAAVTEDGMLYIWGSRLSHRPKLVERRLFNDLAVTKVVIGGDSSNSVFAVITEDNSLWTIGDASSKMIGNIKASGKIVEPNRVKALEGKKVLDVFTGFGQHIMAKVEIDPSEL